MLMADSAPCRGRQAFCAPLSQVLYRYWIDRVGEFEAEDARVEVEFAVEGALDVLGASEAVLLALERYVGDRYSFLPQGREHLLGLLRGHDLVFETLEEDHGTRESPGRVYRRALHVEVRAPWVGPDQAVEVARLELVGLPRQGLDIADAEVARAGGERILERERAERRVAARAAAGDHQPLSVHEPALGEVNRPVGAVVDVDDTPHALEATTVFPPVARAPTVVHVEHGYAAAGPVLDLRVQGRAGCRGRTPVAHYEKGREFAIGRHEVPILRRVEESVRRLSVLRGKLDGLGNGEVARVYLQVAGAPQDLVPAGGRVQPHYAGGLRRRAAEEEYARGRFTPRIRRT